MKHLCMLFLLLHLPFFAFTQINESDTVFFKTKLSVSGTWQQGNAELFIVRGKAEAFARLSKNIAFKTQNVYLYQSFFQNKADEDIFSRNFIYFYPQKKVYPFLISFISHNFRRKIDFRYFVGAGATLKIIDKPKHNLKTALSGVYEESEFLATTFNKTQYNGKNNIQTWRATAWLLGSHSIIDEKLIFHYESYVQPSLEYQDNFRWQLETGLEVPLWKDLFFSTSFLYTHENIIIEGLKTYDRLLLFGFSYQFKK